MKNSNWDVLINRLQRDDLISRDVDQLTQDQVSWIADALAGAWDRAWVHGMINYLDYVMDNTTDAATYNALATERDGLLKRKNAKGW